MQKQERNSRKSLADQLVAEAIPSNKNFPREKGLRIYDFPTKTTG